MDYQQMPDPQHIAALEQIIRSRRSIRSFSGHVPEEVLRKIVESAVYAPYAAGTGIPLAEIRKVFIFRQDSAAIAQAQEIIARQLRKAAFGISIMVRLLPFLSRKMGFFARQIKNTAENGIPGLRQGSFYIVVAEKKGFPAVEQQALAHVMQNIWLTATAHGVGFQLLSLTGSLAKNRQFMDLLGLPPKQWALAGCLVGMPSRLPTTVRQRDPEPFIHWL
jgi:nitroreductase